MRIGFLVHRDLYYKYFAPVIKEALSGGHEVFALHDYSQPREGKKAYQFPSLDKAPIFQSSIGLFSFSSQEEFLDILDKEKIKVIVSLHFTPQYENWYAQVKKRGGFWVALQSVGDILASAEYLSFPDRHFLYSDFWTNLSLRYLELTGEIARIDRGCLKEKIKTVGSVELDQREVINQKRIKQEWGIPEEKKVVLFLPFPFSSLGDRFWVPFIFGMNNLILQLPLALLSFNKRYWRQVLGRVNDASLVGSVKDFCLNNNAFLLVKSRKKTPVRSYLSKVADKVLYDESLYPSTILKCLSISDLCINFFSSTVLEAVPMGVSNVCVGPSPKDWKDIQTPLWQTILKHGREMYDFRGASYLLSPKEAIKTFSRASFSDFPIDQKQREAYIKRFVGPVEGGYSKKALQEIEKMSKIS